MPPLIPTLQHEELVNSQRALDALFSTHVTLGAGVSLAAGPRGSGEGAAMTTDFVSFSRNRGAFASMALNEALAR